MSSGRIALQDLLIRLTNDRAFAQAVQENPEAYGLTAGELALLLAARVDSRAARPQRLEERRSRSGLVFGGEFVAAAGDHHVDFDGDDGHGHHHHPHDDDDRHDDRHDKDHHQKEHHQKEHHQKEHHQKEHHQKEHHQKEHHHKEHHHERADSHFQDSRQQHQTATAPAPSPPAAMHPAPGDVDSSQHGTSLADRSAPADHSSAGQWIADGEHSAPLDPATRAILNHMRESISDAMHAAPTATGNGAEQIDAVMRAITTALCEAEQGGSLPAGFSEEFAQMIVTTLLHAQHTGQDTLAQGVQHGAAPASSWVPPVSGEAPGAGVVDSGDFGVAGRPEWVPGSAAGSATGGNDAPVAMPPGSGGPRPGTSTFEVGHGAAPASSWVPPSSADSPGAGVAGSGDFGVAGRPEWVPGSVAGSSTGGNDAQQAMSPDGGAFRPETSGFGIGHEATPASSWVPPSSADSPGASVVDCGDFGVADRPEWAPGPATDSPRGGNDGQVEMTSDGAVFRPETTTFEVGNHQIFLVPNSDPPRFAAQKLDANGVCDNDPAEAIPLTYADTVNKDGVVIRTFTYPDGHVDVVSFDIQWGIPSNESASSAGDGQESAAEDLVTHSSGAAQNPAEGVDPSAWKP